MRRIHRLDLTVREPDKLLFGIPGVAVPQAVAASAQNLPGLRVGVHGGDQAGIEARGDAPERRYQAAEHRRQARQHALVLLAKQHVKRSVEPAFALLPAEEVRRIDANLAVTGDRALPCGLALARIAQTSSIFLPRAKWMSKKYSNPTVCAFGLAPIGYLLACVLNQLERERVAGRD